MQHSISIEVFLLGWEVHDLVDSAFTIYEHEAQHRSYYHCKYLNEANCDTCVDWEMEEIGVEGAVMRLSTYITAQYVLCIHQQNQNHE